MINYSLYDVQPTWRNLHPEGVVTVVDGCAYGWISYGISQLLHQGPYEPVSADASATPSLAPIC